jgi:hypothetical protein
VNIFHLYLWLDWIKPLLKAISIVLLLGSGVIAARVARTPGLLLLSIACFLSALTLLGDLTLDAQLQWKLHLLSPPVRNWAIVLAIFLNPIQLFLWPIAVILIAREHRVSSTRTI